MARLTLATVVAAAALSATLMGAAPMASALGARAPALPLVAELAVLGALGGGAYGAAFFGVLRLWRKGQPAPR